MTESEATTYLHLTARTLRNYRQSGKLPYREVPGKTRPTIEYQQNDLDRLKVELEKRRQRSKKPTPVKPALPRVTFSLPNMEHKEVLAEAQKFGMAPGEYARRVVRERLESRLLAEAEELREQVNNMEAEMRKMRNEFSLAFEAVLEFGGLSPEEAKEWVTHNLR